MNLHPDTADGFCWVDLAAVDAGRAEIFYRQVFGWVSHQQPANGGVFTRLRSGGRDIGSIYQLSRTKIEQQVPSHWTPYIRVADMDDTARRVEPAGGKVLVRPFVVADIARIALVADSVGATVGLWEAVA